MGHGRYLYGVVVPVRNEAGMLPMTVPRLLTATEGDPVRIVWVCNGCCDDSADIIRRLAGARAEVVELARPGKTIALQAGDDALGDLFPRLYLDADTWLRPGDPARLMQPLFADTADLVAPSLRFDTTGASSLAAGIGACWVSLPHAQTTAFSNAIGLSAAGRSLWNFWPEIIGDDIFVSAQVPDHRKVVVAEALATISMPKTFFGWARMRARWLQGERELAQMALPLPRARSQKFELVQKMVRQNTALGAWAFVAARILAGILQTGVRSSAWVPDRSEP